PAPVAPGRRADREPRRGFRGRGDRIARRAPAPVGLHPRAGDPQPGPGGAGRATPLPESRQGRRRMRWRDALGLALRAVSRRFGRASLTLLAVALATALLTALVVIAATAKTRVIGQLTKGGPLASIRVQ